MITNRIVITGLGAICASGRNIREFWSALAAGDTAIADLSPAIEGIQMRVAAQVNDYDARQYFSDDQLSLLDRFSQFAVIAAREAIRDAGFQSEDEVMSGATAIVGSGCGGKHTDEETYLQLYKKQRARAHPLTIPKGMPSAAASMVSSHLGVKGPVFSLASACASSAHAIAQGSMMIQTGHTDVALVGGADAPFTYGLLKAWDALRVVSNDTCRPFSKDRSGMVLGEGAGILVLESEQHARQRGARIYAEILGCAMSSDAGHITRPDADGISRVMSKAMRYAGITPRQVTYINAHGTGTQLNDVIETQAIHQAFGDQARRLRVSSTKSMHGHAMGASSALELIATVLAMKHHCIPPTANFTGPDRQCDLDYVPNEARRQPVDIALSNAFAFGGLNVVLALGRYRE